MILAVFLAACDGMKTELDIDSIAFPPKLCVTAILDGASGTFSIVLTEGRALADYKTPQIPEEKIIRNGEIRLYEDDRLILSEAGEFDLALDNDVVISDHYGTGSMWFQGHHFEAGGITTNPGSAYRLEVEVDGYKTVTSTSAMPTLPDVSATIDTSVIVKKNSYKEYYSLAGWSYSGGSGGDINFWPVSLQWGGRASGRNYYALEMHEEKTLIEGVPNEWNREGRFNIGICVSDLSKLQDNPEVEIFENQEIDMDASSMNAGMYRFPILLMSDMGFTDNNASLTLYKERVYTIDQGQYHPPENKRVVYHRKLTLRVRHITEATFRYYRSLAMQSVGMDFFTEPVNIVGNIENGYGGFTVFHAVDIPLFECKTIY